MPHSRTRWSFPPPVPPLRCRHSSFLLSAPCPNREQTLYFAAHQRTKNSTTSLCIPEIHAVRDLFEVAHSVQSMTLRKNKKRRDSSRRFRNRQPTIEKPR